MTNAAIIQYGVSGLAPDQCYLNIGTYCGFSLFAGMIGNPSTCCIGVDNFSEFDAPEKAFTTEFTKRKSPHHLFFNMDYVRYLTTVHTQPIGFYFYDAAHTYNHQLQGLRLAEPFFAPGCIVMVDDTNDPAPRRATLDFLTNSQHQYRILLDQCTIEEGGHPTFWNGLIILQRTES